MTLVSHKYNAVRLRMVSAKAFQVGTKPIRTPTAKSEQTASPDCHVPSGSMLRDNSVAWGTYVTV